MGLEVQAAGCEVGDAVGISEERGEGEDEIRLRPGLLECSGCVVDLGLCEVAYVGGAGFDVGLDDHQPALVALWDCECGMSTVSRDRYLDSVLCFDQRQKSAYVQQEAKKEGHSIEQGM